MQDYHNFLEEILIPTDELQKRIAEIGEEINKDYLIRAHKSVERMIRLVDDLAWGN